MPGVLPNPDTFDEILEELKRIAKLLEELNDKIGRVGF